jgi:adenylate cyclase
MSRWAFWALPLAVLAGALFLQLDGTSPIPARIETALFDTYQQLYPRAYEDPRARAGFSVRYVDIDAESLARYGAWPWPQALLARLLEQLKKGGAAMVALSFSLAGPDADAQEHSASASPVGSELDAEQRFAAAISAAHGITGFELVSQTSEPAPVIKSTPALIGAGVLGNHVPAFKAAKGAPTTIENASEGVGALNLIADSDGGMRRLPLIFSLNGKLVPSLDAEVLRLIHREPRIVVHARQPADGLVATPKGVASIESGAAIIPTSADGRLWIYFTLPREEMKLSASQVLEGKAPAAQLANAIVYVGSGNEAPLLTALGDRRPEAAIRAEAMTQILLGQFLRRPAYVEQSEMLFLVLAGLALIFLFARKGALWAGGLFLVVAGGAAVFSWRMFEDHRLLFDAAYPVLSLALVYSSGLAVHWGTFAHTRDRLHRTFEQLLPAHALSIVSQQPRAMKLAGETRTMSYLVCRIRDFGKLAETFADDPQGLSRLMKRVMTPLADAVLTHRGAVDRIAPGTLSALFNAPLEDPDHAVHACECALRMIDALEKVNRGLEQERRADGSTVGPIGISIGINTGPGIVADFGTNARPEYTAAGRAASLTPEIEALSSRYGPAIIVGEATRNAGERNFAFLEVDMLAGGAGGEALKLYALLGNPLVRASPKFRALQTFHDHIFQSYRAQQWAKTRALIAQCRTLSGASQQLYDLYLSRIAYLEDNPPGPSWDGAFHAELA